MIEIEKHNAGDASYIQGMNQFTGLPHGLVNTELKGGYSCPTIGALF